MKKLKMNDKGDFIIFLDPLSDEQIEAMANESLAKFKLSSTVAYGPNPALLSCLLEAFNKACLRNLPDTVLNIAEDLLDSGATRYIEAPKREVILAMVRALCMVNPGLKFKEVFDAYFKLYYPREVHSMEEVLSTPLPPTFEES